MKFSKKPIALAALTLLAGAPLASQAAVSVYFKAPSSGTTLNNTTWNNTSACEVAGSGISRTQFVLINSSGNTINLNTDTSSPFRCNLVSSSYPNGSYTLRVFAYDSSGNRAVSSRSLTIKNATSTPTSDAKPTISFTAPANNATVSALTTCQVSAKDDKGVKQVQFFMDNTLLSTDTTSSYTCSIDNKKYTNGAHTLRAVVTDSANQTTSAQIAIHISGGIASTTTNTPPILSITAPAAGSTLAGTVAYSASASDTGGSVAKVEMYLVSGTTQKLVDTKTAAPYSGTFSTAGVPNGAATLMAVATDNLGAKSTVQRSVTINNTVVSDPGGSTGGSTSAVDPAHIVFKASADLAWSSQSGFSAQAMGGSKSASSIPEPGITGSTLSNGETLRLGKVTDPLNSLNKALQFQVDPGDPTTSGGKRAELSMTPAIEMNKVYWMTVSAYVKDWGNLSDADAALFALQMHSGDNSRSLSPSFGIYTSNGGRSFKVAARWSTSSDPQQGNSEKIYYGDYPIQFGRWVDFVVKFKHNTSGSGFMQVWADGQQIVNHQGNLGFNTPGFKDYGKFGYYNWSGSAMNSTRKVLLRAPTLVADPTGSTYRAEQIRSLLGAGATSVAGGSTAGSTSSTGSTTTTADSGVCSTALCVATQ
jgi:hypothetical protein